MALSSEDTMATIVQKFGGSSLADLEKLGKVADLVMATRRAGHQLVVVVSAMGKTTDGLLELARKAAAAPNTAAEPSRRELDMLVSTGERVSMALLSIAIRARGGDAVSLTGSQSGIITNDRHFDARIVEVRPYRIEDELARGRIVIVAGYQGMSYRREITTLGRGGSDTTAVALAAALAAERCEIYSDVDGVYSADPHRVPGALHLADIDYETMQEMAECGAKVLNARAVEWARKHRVTIAARRTDDFACGQHVRETRVGDEALLRPRAVVGDRRVALVRAPAGSARALLSAASAAELTLRDLVIEGGHLTASVSLSSCPDFARARALLALAVHERLEIVEALGQVSVVGVGVGSDPALVGAALESLPEPPLTFTTTPLRASAVVPESALLSAEGAWHAAFVGEAAASRAA